MTYLILIEETGTGFPAYSPDRDGCAATGRTRGECEANMREAIEFHIEGMRGRGMAVPEPRTTPAYVTVAA